MKRILKIILLGCIVGAVWTIASLAIDFLKLDDYFRELIFFTCGFFYCAYIMDKS